MVGILLTQWLRWLTLLASFTVIAACHTTPSVEQLPIGERSSSFLESGNNSRDKVESILGTPSLVRGNSAISIYVDHRAFVYGDTFTKHLLIIHYNTDGIVESYEVLSQGMLGTSGICTTDNLCFSSTSINIVYDQPGKDSVAKQFSESNDYCSIYLYVTDFFPSLRAPIEISQMEDKSQSYMIDEDSYLNWLAKPGRVEISAKAQLAIDHEYEFECEQGQIYFIHVHLGFGWSKYHFTIEQDDKDTGEQSVLERRLILQ